MAHESILAPTVHLNGTDGEELASQIRTALEALDTALEALNGAAPNGRDYYIQTSEAWRTVCAQHRARVAKLVEVHSELSSVLDSVQDQIDARSH